MPATAITHDAIVTVAAAISRRRRVHPKRRPVLVNVGSSLVVADGWINLDAGLPALIAGWPRPFSRLIYRLMPSSSAAKRDYTEQQFCDILHRHDFVHHRIEHGLPFADATVDAIFASHVVEHLYRSDALEFFRAAYRALKVGGLLRVCVPDLDHIAGLLMNGSREHALEYFFYDRGPSSYTRHRYLYDFESLSRSLRHAGFDVVHRCQYREGKVPDLEALDNRPDETLYVEAVKGPRNGMPSEVDLASRKASIE